MLETDRLILRNWEPEDLEPFYKLSSDPRVMEFMSKTLNRDESNSFANKTIALINKNGYGLWAIETKAKKSFIGYIGLNAPSFEAPFTPCIEIGWRLSSDHWGKGYATEGAKAALIFGFEEMNLKEIVSFTVPNNRRSRNVMERLGMRRNPNEDFDHPNLASDDPLCRHVLYRLKN